MTKIQSILKCHTSLLHHLTADLKRASQLHNTIVAAYKQSTNETTEIKTLESDFQELMSCLTEEAEKVTEEVADEKSEDPKESKTPEAPAAMEQ